MERDISVLEREEIVLPELDEEKKLNLELADRSKRELGYGVLVTHLENAYRISKLRTALKILGIRPFSQESVERYKAEKLKEVKITNQPLERLANLRGTVDLLCSCFGVGFILCVFGGVALFQGGYPNLATISFILTIGCVVGISLCFHADNRLREVPRSALNPWRWHAVPLADYPKEVPEFVLQRALQIKEQLPDAQFLVEHITNEVQVIDPFLQVRHGCDQAYIEVWGEPKFEANLRLAS